MKEKKVLIEIDNVRISEYDSMNVIVERYEEVLNKKTTEFVSKWRFKAYASTIFDALKMIAKNEWLINKSSITDLKSYLEQVEKSNEKVLGLMK